MDEGTLIRRASSGDRHAFSILVRTHQAGVYRWIRRMVRDEEAARDLTQETFLRGFRALPLFRGDAAFGTWLRTIAANLARSHLRAEAGRVHVPLAPGLASGGPSPDAEVLAAADRRALSRALARLPPRQREVVMLRIYEDLSYSEIARAIGTSETSAKVSFHHALKRLRRLMAVTAAHEPVREGVPGATMIHPESGRRSMPHGAWEDLMIEALDGRAGEERRAELERHVAGCPECRAAYDDYRELFAGLREADEEELPREFWDSLAAGVERRIAQSAQVAGNAEGGGWKGVAGGLLAAGVAVLILAALYLELPRTPGEPQAFTTPPARVAEEGAPDPVLAGIGNSRAPGEPDEGAEDAGSAALLALSALAGETYVGLGPVREAQDPLADLASAEEALEDLTPAEAEELITSLEGQL